MIYLHSRHMPEIRLCAVLAAFVIFVLLLLWFKKFESMSV